MFIFKKIIIKILIWESRLILRKYKPFIVAVTGSVGKTSTKDAIYCVLKDQSKYVRKSDKSFNSDIGLPLTVIGVPNAWHSVALWLENIHRGLSLILKRQEYPDCLILEIGADYPGDIKKIAKWLHPDISVITMVSRTPVHVEFFTSPEQVFEEKFSLVQAVKDGGTVILFADDEKVMSMKGMIKDKDVKVLSYGTNPEATVRSGGVSTVYESNMLGATSVSNTTEGLGISNSKQVDIPIGITFDLIIEGRTEKIRIGNVLGNVYQYPLLAAAAVGKARNLSFETIVKGLNTYEAPHGRMNIIPGLNETTIIDDTYNSSPDATLSALQALKDLKCNGTKIAVLGDMMELGKYASEEHRSVGRAAANVVGRLITVGQRSRSTAGEAVQAGLAESAVVSFDSSSQVPDYLVSIMKPGDIILVKGSQSIRMERVVKALMREPDRAARLLVRQEKEWLEKA